MLTALPYARIDLQVQRDGEENFRSQPSQLKAPLAVSDTV